MQVSEEKKGNVSVLALSGRLDTETSQSFQDVILSKIDAGETLFVIDCSNLDYISSVGLRVFLMAAKKLKPASGKLVLASMQDSIKEVFDIAGFSSLFPSYPSVDEAVQSLS